VKRIGNALEDEDVITVTISRYITVSAKLAPPGALEPVIVLEALTEDGDEVELTYEEHLSVKQLVLAGHDETGR